MSSLPPATILPLLSALGYTFAALMLKRATERGVGAWRITFITNWVAAVVFAPWWLTGGEPFSWMNLGRASLCGLTFFIGQIFTFLALTRGDVSVSTPVLGTKVIFVAVLGVAIAGEKLTPGLWAAALITAIATALLGGGSHRASHQISHSLFFGFTAAAAFALADTLQQRWVRYWGFGHFAPVMLLSIAVFSVSLIPFFREPLSKLSGLTLRWAFGGALMLSAQATGIAYVIATYREVTKTNILYNTRGMWSVILVWVVGHWFGNYEREQGSRVMLRRLIGSGLLLSAVFLCVRRSP
jgi:drug/metabolite transporter (DMT)-like permease